MKLIKVIIRFLKDVKQAVWNDMAVDGPYSGKREIERDPGVCNNGKTSHHR